MNERQIITKEDIEKLYSREDIMKAGKNGGQHDHLRTFETMEADDLDITATSREEFHTLLRKKFDDVFDENIAYLRKSENGDLMEDGKDFDRIDFVFDGVDEYDLNFAVKRIDQVEIIYRRGTKRLTEKEQGKEDSRHGEQVKAANKITEAESNRRHDINLLNVMAKQYPEEIRRIAAEVYAEDSQ